MHVYVHMNIKIHINTCIYMYDCMYVEKVYIYIYRYRCVYASLHVCTSGSKLLVFLALIHVQ